MDVMSRTTHSMREAGEELGLTRTAVYAWVRKINISPLFGRSKVGYPARVLSAKQFDRVREAVMASRKRRERKAQAP